MKDILVIGGSNIDYLAKSSHPLIMEDSNIGSLKTAFGGVGRNIVENLARLGDKVTFLTGIGSDSQGQHLKKELESLSVKVLSPKTDYPSGSYVSIANDNGDMAVAVCDTRLLDAMTPEDLVPFKDVIAAHKEIVLDANINEAVIDYLFQTYPDHAFLIEGVSANKVRRFRNHVSEIALFKSNVLEASYFLGVKEDPKKLVSDLLSLGAKNVVLSQGKAPILYGYQGKVYEEPVVACPNIVSVNGAGDALFAGIVHGLVHQQSLMESLRFGARMSLATLQVESAVDPKIGRLIKE
ncbi:MAG: carbohydrate kinase family protein [Bacilli bacterium]|jgi:pseudouridine kinase|nr:carbohydrate kinase family protein [Bacilli bacterium]